MGYRRVGRLVSVKITEYQGEISRKSRGRCVKSGLVKDGEKEARKKEDLRN